MYVYKNGKLVYQSDAHTGKQTPDVTKPTTTGGGDNDVFTFDDDVTDVAKPTTTGGNASVAGDGDNDVMTFGVGDLDAGSRVVNTWDEDAGTIVPKDPDGNMASTNAGGLNDKTKGGLGGDLYKLTNGDAAAMQQQTGQGKPARTADEEQTGPAQKDMSDDEYLKSLMPMSKEEEERRLRGAKAAQGIAHLGNVFASLGNVIFTGKGAPSQKMGEVQNPDYDRLLERNKQQNQIYQAAVKSRDQLAMQERKLEVQERYQEERLQLQWQMQALQQTKTQVELEWKREANEQKRAKLEKELEKIDEQIQTLRAQQQATLMRAEAYASGVRNQNKNRDQRTANDTERAHKYKSGDDDDDDEFSFE